MALIDNAPRQLQAILDLHGIQAQTCQELERAERVAILNTLYQILDILDSKTNSILNLNVIILTAQVFIASSSQPTQLGRFATAALYAFVLVPLVSTGWALYVFHVRGGSFLRWRGAGCVLVDPSAPLATPASIADAMWSEFRSLAIICDQRCRHHRTIRRWTVISGLVLLITIVAVVAHLLRLGYAQAVMFPVQHQAEVVTLNDLSAPDRQLLISARDVSRRAYAPYSRFGVGAAVRTRSGAVYAGANMENASYGLTLCAENSALLQSVAAGDFSVEAIAVVGGPLNGASTAGQPVTPCGRCRQLLFEAAQVAGTDVKVISANTDFSRITVRRISELLPEAFGPRDLG